VSGAVFFVGDLCRSFLRRVCEPSSFRSFRKPISRWHRLIFRSLPSLSSSSSCRHSARQREKKEKISARNQNGTPLLDEKRSLSLIFRGAKTLDLLVDVGGDREMILYVLNSLVAEYGRAKVKVGNEVLLLRYIWNDIDRVSEGCLSFVFGSRRRRFSPRDEIHRFRTPPFQTSSRITPTRLARRRWGSF